MKYMSLKGKTKSLFNDLRSIFRWSKGGEVSGHEGWPVQDLNALIGSGSYFGLAPRLRHDKRAPVITEPGSEPLREREEKQGGRKRKGTKGPKYLSAVLKRGTQVMKKGLSITDMSPPPPPPATSTLAMRVEPDTTVAQLEKSSLTSFNLRRELEGTSSRVEAIVTPTTDSLTGSPTCSSLSLGDVLCTFTKEENGEAVDEVSSVETTVLELPFSVPPEVEFEIEPPLELPPSELVMTLGLEMSILEAQAEEPSFEPLDAFDEPLALVIRNSDFEVPPLAAVGPSVPLLPTPDGMAYLV
ncbi:hypothetical protein AMTR_s00076p00173930, partial [Amborella trichopoda]